MFPCYFGIDIHDKENLIATKKTVEEIRREIGADSLGYLSIESLRKTAGYAGVGLCDGCFTKSFSAKIPTEFFVDKYANKINNK